MPKFDIPEHKKQLVFIGFLLVTIWICVHGYQGMKHDAVLYLGQALFHSNPDIYKNDLFFLYGSQDQFSFFSSVYAWVISHLGIGHGAILLFITSQALFLT